MVPLRAVVPERPDMEQDSWPGENPLYAASGDERRSRCCQEPGAGWEHVNTTCSYTDSVQMCKMTFIIYHYPIMWYSGPTELLCSFTFLFHLFSFEMNWIYFINPRNRFNVGEMLSSGQFQNMSSLLSWCCRLFAELLTAWDGCQKYFYRSWARRTALQTALQHATKVTPR